MAGELRHALEDHMASVKIAKRGTGAFFRPRKRLHSDHSED
jgi:hypothetical protein